MIDAEVFVIADAIVAAIFALVFFVVRLFDRRLKDLAWWAAAFICLALMFVTITTRADDPRAFSSMVSWMGSFGFGAALLIGVARSYSQRIPRAFILAMAVVQMALMVGGLLMLASAPYWEIYVRIPTVLLMLAGIFVLWQAGATKVSDRVMTGAILVMAGVFMARGFWFSTMFGESAPIDDPAFITRAVIVVVGTILAEVVIAMAFILSAVLGNLARMREELITDSLSRLHRREAFDEEVAEMLVKAEAYGVSVSLIWIDLDYFKVVNDTYGHQAGDQVISIFGTLLKNMLPSGDIAGRIGGEEFAIASYGLDADGARELANQVRQALEELKFVFLPAKSQITGSFGVAEVKYGETLKSAILRADKALYAAKSSGRNRVCVSGVDTDPEDNIFDFG